MTKPRCGPGATPCCAHDRVLHIRRFAKLRLKVSRSSDILVLLPVILHVTVFLERMPMSKNPEQPHNDKKSKESSLPSSSLLTRAEAAALLHCSISSIRRLEGHTLHPLVGPDGVHRFDPVDLVRVASERSTTTIDASKEGERDAKVFDALEDGKMLREIVTTMRLPVDVATKLHTAWLKMGDGRDMVLSNARLAQLRDALQADLKRPGDLVEEVHWLAEERSTLEGERNKLDQQLADLLAVVGKMIAVDPEIASALSESGNALDTDLASRLDAAVKFFANESARSPTSSPDAAREDS